MKVNEILEQYDEYEDENTPTSQQVSFTLIAPDEYRMMDDHAEVTMDVDVETTETEYEGPHVFAQGGFEVIGAWFADDYTFMGSALSKGLDMPPGYIPYIDFNEDDIRAMGEKPTVNMQDEEREEMFQAFIEHRIKTQVTVPERRYPVQR